jgi:MFS transporter, PAT family, beta-lactamase induction signal transducer AmpG
MPGMRRSSRLLLGTLILAHGFSSGLPLALLQSSLQVWLAEGGLSLQQVGMAGVLTLPYSCKIFAAPLLDRFSIPFLPLRKGWLFFLQGALVLTIFLAAFVGKLGFSSTFFGILSVVAILSALQDIVIDALRVELTPTSRDGGWISTLAVLGYRLGMLTSGAVALYLAEYYPWHQVYMIVASTMIIGVGATIFCSEPENHRLRSRDVKAIVVEPFKNFFMRRGALEIFLFLFLFKSSEMLAVALRSNFLLELGYSKPEIAQISKLYGLCTLIIGGFVGGIYLSKVGLRKSVLTLGGLLALSFLLFSALAIVGKNNTLFISAIIVEEFANGMVTAAILAFMLQICAPKYAATQYALLSSLLGLPRLFLSGISGYLAVGFGWPLYFLTCSLLALPALFLWAVRFSRWEMPQEESLQ